MTQRKINSNPFVPLTGPFQYELGPSTLKSDCACASFAPAASLQDELSVWLRAFHAPDHARHDCQLGNRRAVVPAVYIPVLAYALKVEVTDILPRLTLKDLKAGQIHARVPPPARRPQPIYKSSPPYECDRANKRNFSLGRSFPPGSTQIRRRGFSV